MTTTSATFDLSAARTRLRQCGYANLLDRRLNDGMDTATVSQDAADIAVELHALGIRHEAKAIGFDPRPFLLSGAAYDGISIRFARLAPLLERAIEAYLEDERVREFFALAPRHDRLIRMGAHYRPRVQYCRFDFTLDQAGRPWIYELNTHCPAAATYSVHFARLTAASRIGRVLAEQGLRHRGLPLERPASFAKALLTAAHDNGHQVHTAAVLNSKYLTMNTELDHIAQQFRDCGVEAVRCHVEDLVYRAGQLSYAGRPIELTYNKYDDSSGPDAYECAFSRTTAEVQPYLDAIADGAVFAVNSLPSMYLPEQKSMLAFLHSELFGHRCEPAERELISEIVPMTLIVRRLSAQQLAGVRAERAGWVLKRSLDTRGRSLVIGRSATERHWQHALDEALRAEPGDDWVVQQLAAPMTADRSPIEAGEAAGATEVGAAGITGRVHSALACFLVAGEPSGLIVRTSVEETTNVGRSGFMQAPVVVD